MYEYTYKYHYKLLNKLFTRTLNFDFDNKNNPFQFSLHFVLTTTFLNFILQTPKVLELLDLVLLQLQRHYCFQHFVGIVVVV